MAIFLPLHLPTFQLGPPMPKDPNPQDKDLKDLKDLSTYLCKIEKDPQRVHEAWAVAQTLGARIAPQTQTQLDKVRREVMASLKPSGFLAPQRAIFRAHPRRPHWTQIQIAPEVHEHKDLIGQTAPLHLLKKLKTTLQAQINAIRAFERKP